VRGPGDFLRELFQERFDDVGGLLRLKVKTGALGKYIGNERQCEGMTVREIENRRVFFGGNAAPRQVIAAFLRTQITQCDGVDHFSQIGAPSGGGRVAACQNEERFVRQLR
jgi:hypothetical protein